MNSKGVETTGHTAFSLQTWGKETLQYLESVNVIPTDEMEQIIKAASKFVKHGRHLVERSANKNDPRCRIIEGTCIEDEPDDDAVVEGWGRVADLRSSSPPAEPQPEVSQQQSRKTSQNSSRSASGSSRSVLNTVSSRSTSGSSGQGSSKHPQQGSQVKASKPSKTNKYVLVLWLSSY